MRQMKIQFKKTKINVFRVTCRAMDGYVLCKTCVQERDSWGFRAAYEMRVYNMYKDMLFLIYHFVRIRCQVV